MSHLNSHYHRMEILQQIRCNILPLKPMTFYIGFPDTIRFFSCFKRHYSKDHSCLETLGPQLIIQGKHVSTISFLSYSLSRNTCNYGTVN